MRRLFIALSLLAATGCSRNVDWVKERAETRWKELGYSEVVYEGYSLSPLCGGDVWYQVKRADSPGIVYSGYLCRWGDELHLYGPKVISGSQFNLKGGPL